MTDTLKVATGSATALAGRNLKPAGRFVQSIQEFGNALNRHPVFSTPLKVGQDTNPSLDPKVMVRTRPSSPGRPWVIEAPDDQDRTEGFLSFGGKR